MNRRSFLQCAGWGLMLGSPPGRRARAQDSRVAPAVAFDEAMRRYLDAWDIPGGALAVLKDGERVHTRNYGWADAERKISIHSGSLFRIASLSKPITALAILKLVEEERINLEDRVFEILGLTRWAPREGAFDELWRQVTIGQLLHHTGGWDRDQSFDPMFRARPIARHFGIPSPAGAWEVIRYMLEQPLDFPPGQRYAYSNFGYCLLGRIIENASGVEYDAYVRQAILQPAGCTHMQLGHSRVEQRAEHEVEYHMDHEETTDSVFDSHPGRVPAPDGGFHLEAMDAHGGWIASVEDLARLTAALDSPRPSPLLSTATLNILRAPPPPPAWRNEDGTEPDHFYGCGWMVRPMGDAGRANLWHSGSLPGTTALWVRRHDGVSYAALFNQRTNNTSRPDLNIDPMLYRAADRVDWD